MLQLPALLAPGTRVGDMPIRHKTANEFLKECRASMLGDDGAVVHWDRDLTYGTFDWKRYLSYHPQSQELIGTGVIKFEGRFLNSWDHNMHQPRFDFIVHRTDGTAARLHPSRNGPGHIVTGALNDWLCDSQPRPLLMERNAGATEHNAEQPFRALHQVDTISRRQASVFLEQQQDAWQSKQHPRGPFMVNLMVETSGHSDGHFYFSHYLNATPWGRELVLDVDSFYLVWLLKQERPGFWMRLRNGSCATLDVMSHGPCVPKWNEESDEVLWR